MPPRRPEVPPAYKEVGDWKPAQPNDQNLAGNWWEIFQDPQLNATPKQQINVSNQNLKAAEAQYTQARALLPLPSRADYFPTVTVESGGNPQPRPSSNRRQPHSAQFSGVSFTDLQIPFELSYQVDVWGRVRRTVESYRDQAQASAADLATVNLSMHSQLALFYFQARMLDAEEQLLNSTVTQYEQALELIKSRYAGGIASDVEVQQAETQLETTRAQAIDVGVARAQYEHAVAVLIGKPPASFSLAPLPLTIPPPADSRGPAFRVARTAAGHRSCGTPNGRCQRADRSGQGLPIIPTLSAWGRPGDLRVVPSRHWYPAPAFCGRPGHLRCLLSSTLGGAGLPQTKRSLLTIKRSPTIGKPC